jgi:hypothetical protein
MIGCFAIIPDGDRLPSALFVDLQDAMDWGLETYGGDAFSIKYMEVAPVESADLRAANRSRGGS